MVAVLARLGWHDMSTPDQTVRSGRIRRQPIECGGTCATAMANRAIGRPLLPPTRHIVGV
jgi:hypothetical protein